jgi:pyruvate dehydrogenase E1 component alpha subunit
VKSWRERDPIPAFARTLIKDGVATEDELRAIDESVEQECVDAVAFADQSPLPDPASAYTKVYSKPLGDY